ERLRAQINNAPSFVPSQELVSNAPYLVMQEQERFRSNQAKKKNDIAIARKDLGIRQKELEESKTKLKDAKQQYQYALEQAKIAKPLADQKFYSQVEYIKIKR